MVLFPPMSDSPISRLRRARDLLRRLGRRTGRALLASAAREGRGRRAISRLPVSLRIVLESLLRNWTGAGSGEGRRRAGQLEAERRAHGRNSVRRRAHRPPGLHRRAAARGPRGHALGGGAAGTGPGDRAARARRARGRPLGPGRLLVDARRAAAEHGDRVQAQPRALRVPEVGHAGVPRLRRRAAGHRHRAPGQPGVPRARASSRGTASTSPTRSSAPTRTRP